MVNGSTAPPSLAFPQDTFARLTPGPFLHAHLKQHVPTRPSGRAPDAFRTPTVTKGSLTHSNGSAVVRVGNTAVVCGVRAEILLASDIPRPPPENLHDADLVEELGLLVPNVELSTGCSPAHVPGNPPSTQAQSLSYRISALLNSANLVQPADLRIEYTEPQTDDDLPDQSPQTSTKAYWTLYVDVLCIALDGNPFDAAWAAVLAALQDTVLPKAWWDADREMVLCSPLAGEAKRLRFNALPVASTFAVYSTASPLKQRSEAEFWVLADPDGFEEGICEESLTVVVAPKNREHGGIVRLERNGGVSISKALLGRCVSLAEKRRSEWEAVLRGG